ncbi:MAG: hypothetical protein GY845_15270 [Planctomycetes bacterium]|nr:hypothetical protein [Planctomycetota bacterium]
MSFRAFSRFVFSAILFTVLVMLTFVVLQWLRLPVGRFIDWLIVIVSFWWLLVIVTFPWNIHFQARKVLVEAAKSVENNIPVKQKEILYVKRWVKLSLIIAIALHLLSAIGLYALAFAGISAVGYIGSGVALLLTALRPVIRAYQYLASRLAAIQRELHYPRQDVVKLRQDVKQIAKQVESLETQLDTKNKHSWAAQQQANLAGLNQELERVRIALNELHTANQTEHNRLSREAEHAIAQITADGQFLDHVREIIRFVKTA